MFTFLFSSLRDARLHVFNVYINDRVHSPNETQYWISCETTLIDERRKKIQSKSCCCLDRSSFKRNFFINTSQHFSVNSVQAISEMFFIYLYFLWMLLKKVCRLSWLMCRLFWYSFQLKTHKCQLQNSQFLNCIFLVYWLSVAHLSTANNYFFTIRFV